MGGGVWVWFSFLLCIFKNVIFSFFEGSYSSMCFLRPNFNNEVVVDDRN